MGYTVARGRGDPHFTTLDGRVYTFNGLGEYVLLRESIKDFEFQGRTELAPNSNATIFSAFAIKDGSDAVEVIIYNYWLKFLAIIEVRNITNTYDTKLFRRKKILTKYFTPKLMSNNLTNSLKT